ncbi:16S rRNA (uracil(1498)-N(3))-methyltransferase [Streptococcus dysgalactiae]|uniref:Ribosomal RNA small subunit methyltransferase E n=1 Tax=Streptococcus dysgalactiae subsp. equisimilis AC-2713 TaxID=759913 RepID=A0AB33R4F6_STREQ|nr:16S rRNA (uracil(1498)-N(3))-methyltransferase [Streptococcus dysgalactiae]OCX08800.1 16S rRNA (uracil(1498)-N(3))-methyltransferase [Streptococcus dysgalactiae subsp. equisimilis AKSDE4288]QJD63067.1 16S rRNA (uracil(1498)-N(3))-methyltransferase [Streptococcus dysgalactiae subsp. equisimilis]QJR38531.1 16S rRNA (uracil(1498)-N(3))-methyltransferase [Streptococcus dysgalactiae subsp. equisimilis]CCI61737.1 K09761 ribosomal RNA small subunit methyltransferase E [Streptococcus dysgalactiae su
MQQYFIKGKAEKEVTITDKDTIKHMFQVMRLTDEAEVVLVFDDGIKYLAKVTNSMAHELEIIEALPDQVELPVKVTIASGFPKGDKLDTIAQKVTELGASALWGYPADWSVVKWDGKKLAKKEDKLAKIVLGAAEQSKRNVVPEVHLFEQKAEFLKSLSSFDHIFIAYEETAKAGQLATLARELKEVKPGAKLLFIFGPEGGISPAEITQFEAAGAIKVGLGPRIMRAETAPLYALSAISYALELQVTSDDN